MIAHKVRNHDSRCPAALRQTGSSLRRVGESGLHGELAKIAPQNDRFGPRSRLSESVEGESTSGSCNTPRNIHIGFVRGAGEIGSPLAVLLTVAAMTIPQI